jgi:hypothetical protein
MIHQYRAIGQVPLYLTIPTSDADYVIKQWIITLTLCLQVSAQPLHRRIMKKKIVRLGKLDKLYVTNRRPNQGVGPCALEASAVLHCWSNVRGGTPDASECKHFVESLTNCMRNYV